MDKLREVMDGLDSLHMAYEGLEILATSADHGQSDHVGHVLSVLNAQLKAHLEELEGLRKGKGLSVVK
ncbi:MAG: hypothetical protein AB1450_09495 [Pseudomonadota bacterium]